MNVLLDLDGTLTDPREGILACLKHALASIGHEAPDDRTLEGFIGPPLQDSLATLLGAGSTDKVAHAVAAYRSRFAATGMFENTVYPDIPQALSRLIERGAILHVATSKPAVFARRIIDHFGLAGYFRGIHGSELDGTRSNKADLIEHLLRTESISPRAAVMVGDRAQDIDGAKRNGLPAIGVLWGYGSREELLAAGADTLCEQPVLLTEAVFPCAQR